jgi:P4 family phage/plasmid primase-like protien
MSFNKYLNNKINNTCDYLIQNSILSLENRNSEDYFFNKSDLDKMDHFKYLIEHYKICNKVYYYFNESSKLWIEELSDDSVINRICSYTSDILLPEKKFVDNILLTKEKDYRQKILNKTIKTTEQGEYQELQEALNDWNKFILSTIKVHQTAKFAKSVLNFFRHRVIDEEFTSKININNHHFLPLAKINLNLKTGEKSERTKEQYFTKALKFDNIDYINVTDEEYIKVDNFFLDICTGSEAKKKYLQKILGYFISGNVSFGRCFFIFYGEGRNGKSAIIEVIQQIFDYYCQAIDVSIIIKRGKKNSGQASPELEVLDYGLRLAILSETDDNEHLNESLIKNITGYDKISYRGLYKKQKDFRTEAKLCMLTNNKPYFSLSQSMVDRIRFINFKSRFGDDDIKFDSLGNKINKNYYKADPNLVLQLKTVYIKYVLAWIIEGAKQFFNDEHMNIPDDPELITENMSYINEMDSYKRFLDEYIIITNNEQDKVLSSRINELYKKFCIDEGIPSIKLSKLKQLLLNDFKFKKNSTNYFYGMQLKENEEADEPVNDLDI